MGVKTEYFCDRCEEGPLQANSQYRDGSFYMGSVKDMEVMFGEKAREVGHGFILCRECFLILRTGMRRFMLRKGSE